MAQDFLVPWLGASGQGGLRNSMLVAAGDGVTSLYSFNFAGGYISKSDVKGYIYNPVTGTATTLTITAGMWQTDSQIKLAAPVPVGQYIVIYRDTQKTTPLVDFTNGAVLNEQNLDRMAQQAINVVAEMADRFDLLNDGSVLAIANSATALSTANAAATAAAAAVVTANATNATAGAAQTASAAATATANAAKTTADGIDAKAQSALDASAAATSTANTAKSTADTAKSTADGLAASIATANTNASTALSTANGVDAKATTALSNSATALAAALGFSGRNKIVNGSMVVAQRAAVTVAGTAGTAVTGYGGPDRFFAYNSAGGSFTQSQITFSPFGVVRQGIKQNVNTAPTNIAGTNFWGGIRTTLEGITVYDLIGQPVAMSFPFLSNVSGTFSFALRDGDGSNSFVTTFTATAGVAKLVKILVPALPAGAVVPPTTSAGLLVVIGCLNTGTFQCPTGSLGGWTAANYLSAQGATNWATAVNNYIAATELQLEAGTVVTPFEVRPYPLELVLCMRYYRKISFPSGPIFPGVTTGATSAYSFQQFETPMRTTPSPGQSASVGFVASGSWNTGGTMTCSGPQSWYLFLAGTGGVSGWAGYFNAPSAVDFTFSAEF